MCDIQFSFYQKKPSSSCNFDDSYSVTAVQTIKTWSSTDYEFEFRAPLPVVTTRKVKEEFQGGQCESPIAALVDKTNNNKKGLLNDYYPASNKQQNSSNNNKKKSVENGVPTNTIQNSNSNSNTNKKQGSTLIELGKCFARLGVSMEAAVSAGLLQGVSSTELDVVRRAHNQQVTYQKLLKMKMEA